jgi:hypothetical protein
VDPSLEILVPINALVATNGPRPGLSALAEVIFKPNLAYATNASNVGDIVGTKKGVWGWSRSC